MLSSQQVDRERPMKFENLNAITRLQADIAPVIEAKIAKGYESTKNLKRHPNKN